MKELSPTALGAAVGGRTYHDFDRCINDIYANASLWGVAGAGGGAYIFGGWGFAIGGIGGVVAGGYYASQYSENCQEW